MASAGDEKGDKNRSFLHGEGEKNTTWRLGAPPSYDVVKKLFEEGRTKIWPPGSLEDKVQNIVKTLEMELFPKSCPDDFKSIDPNKFTKSVNNNNIPNLSRIGGKALKLKETREIGGGYNSFLQTKLPKELCVYDPEEETSESSNIAFMTAFPRGFALEVLEVYSGPPRIAFKFRHWAYMEGPFKGHAPTGDLVEFFGMAVYEVDKEMRLVKVEFFFDRGELLGSLIKGAKIDNHGDLEEMLSSCPVMRAQI